MILSRGDCSVTVKWAVYKDEGTEINERIPPRSREIRFYKDLPTAFVCLRTVCVSPVSSTVIASPVTFLFSLTTWDSCILNRIRCHEPQLLYGEPDSLERRSNCNANGLLFVFSTDVSLPGSGYISPSKTDRL